ncbi:hypothetical protein QEH56_24210 [Pelagicoccus enzymogenes]|uniref:hypothetical protein n=1 Tax=Pelagicoccus enzymogenes TaxID=2773457 RepID=UPI00280E881D|nr:hypothetical protein [Pelagicoccus enzymogenes]MDQ8201286.1 hypothetical protein [Pelagicoccus enzymogenes]
MHTDYESVATYPSYEEANERQTELLSYGLSAFVVRESTGFLEVYMGVVPKFHLFVPKEQASEAREIVQLQADADHVHIANCPKCGSSEVKEIGVVKNYQSGYFAQSLDCAWQ